MMLFSTPAESIVKTYQALGVRRQTIIVLAGFILLSFILYGNTLGGDFVYDDAFFTSRADFGKSSGLLNVWFEPLAKNNVYAGTYRPLTLFTFSLNAVLFGLSSVSFHAVNIILNGLAAFLAWLLLQKLFHDKRLAFISAVIFLFLPIHTEAVVSIKSREEILAAIFMLAAWLVFLYAVSEKNVMRMPFVLISSFFWFLALLSKEFTIMAPFIIFASYYFMQGPLSRPFLTAVMAYIPALLLYVFFRFSSLGWQGFFPEDPPFIQNPLVAADITEKISTAFKIFFMYAEKTFIPVNLSATYAYNALTTVKLPFYSWQSLAGIAAIGLLLFFIIYQKTRATPLGIGALIFLISSIIFTNFIFVAGEIAAERWMYFPSLGLALLAGYAFHLLYERKKSAAVAALGCTLLAYGFITVARNRVWLSEEALFQSMIRTAPESVGARYGMALTYYKNGKIQEAQKQTREAFRIYPEYPPLLALVGNIAMNEGDFASARQFASRSLVIDSTYVDAYVIYALALAKEGKYMESLRFIEPVFSRFPDVSGVRFVIAVNYYKMGDKTRASEFFDWNAKLSEEQKLNELENF